MSAGKDEAMMYGADAFLLISFTLMLSTVSELSAVKAMVTMVFSLLGIFTKMRILPTGHG